MRENLFQARQILSLLNPTLLKRRLETRTCLAAGTHSVIIYRVIDPTKVPFILMLEEFNLLKIVHVFFGPGAVLLEFAG
jgi:hypothetical protein